MVFLEMGIPAKGLWVSVCVCARVHVRGKETEGERPPPFILQAFCLQPITSHTPDGTPALPCLSDYLMEEEVRERKRFV